MPNLLVELESSRSEEVAKLKLERSRTELLTHYVLPEPLLQKASFLEVVLPFSMLLKVLRF